MKYHFIHALVLTSFEASLTSLDWNTISSQDYPIHALYCEELGALLFHSDNQKDDCAKEISKIQNLLTRLGNEIVLSKQIIILRDDENEYNAQDVLKHFSH